MPKVGALIDSLSKMIPLKRDQNQFSQIFHLRLFDALGANISRHSGSVTNIYGAKHSLVILTLILSWGRGNMATWTFDVLQCETYVIFGNSPSIGSRSKNCSYSYHNL